MLIPTVNLLRSETIDEIYAIVNDEIITLSELQTFENGITQELKSKFSGEELKKNIKELKSNLLSMLISRKIILSKAKEKKYDLTQYLKMIIKDIMKRNNLKTEDELKKALLSQGVSFEEFKRQRLEQLMQERFIQEKVGQKMKVDASEIVNYYRQNLKKYTIPEKITLNCIFLKKDLYFSEKARKEKMKKITDALHKEKSDFKKVAEIYSDLTGDNRYSLGTFTKSDLDKNLVSSADKLKEGEYSDWITTDTGWYIIQLEKRVSEHIADFKTLKDKIKQTLSEGKREKELKKLVEQLKKDSYIKIIKEYK